MIHQSGKKKLNCSSKHRKALIRNQALHFIKYGILKTTVARIKEVKKIVEKVVTIAKAGNHFNNIRKVNSILPYDKKAVEKLFKEIAPKYVIRPGGYTRTFLLQQRISDTARIGQLMWVLENNVKDKDIGTKVKNKKDIESKIETKDIESKIENKEEVKEEEREEVL